ncbi:CAP domain-containing protein [Streptomyces tubbatahanensis]|uniref:CAP domain-containing protein n=1 Tax=Streptomyces tubbatahanensis TaxID=2923272 RepID=A0ABY3Y0D5_9ACTN|nr:CAP domain-containing protein [Streptomyces tubbatahanensis]UNT00277.1 CAP domain-containing protein [Streptomyces tubbatahanensis]
MTRVAGRFIGTSAAAWVAPALLTATVWGGCLSVPAQAQQADSQLTAPVAQFRAPAPQPRAPGPRSGAQVPRFEPKPPPAWSPSWQPGPGGGPAPARPRLPSRPGKPSRPAALVGAPAEVLRLVNKERVEAGCPEVDENRALTRAAQRHSVSMARTRVLSHDQPGESGPGRRVAAEGYRWKRVGENVARGQRAAAEVVRAWMRSPKHRATLTTCAFRDAGVGVVSGARGPWWTLVLASRRS